MESTLTTKSSRVLKSKSYEIPNLKHYILSEYNSFESEISLDDELVTLESSENDSNISFSKEKLSNSFEDSRTYLDNLLIGRDFISNETWEKINTIQGRIASFNNIKVFVDCLIDKENKIFEHREFARFFFEHLDELSEKKPIIIKTKINPGSSRIDIYPGEGIVNLELFEINDKWEQLRDSGLDEKLF
tara:strand:- start:1873 stop:2439 length:567 start_codon:yes stop_codon:yes gene_type:complete